MAKGKAQENIHSDWSSLITFLHSAEMPQKLQVRIGANRFAMQLADVNGRPTEIDTPEFVGRVLVRVRDFTGVTHDGEPPKQDPAYFANRSRKFAVLIEGRWKHRNGVEPYTGDEVSLSCRQRVAIHDIPFPLFVMLSTTNHAGSVWLRFRLPPRQLPARTLWNRHENRPLRRRSEFLVRESTAWTTVHHESLHGVHDFILVSLRSLSPRFSRLTIRHHSAYPAPDALSRALLLAHHDSTHPHHEGEEQEGGFVPMSDKSGKRPYWRFVGLTGHAPVDSFFNSHAHLLSPANSRSSSPALGAPSTEQNKPRLELRRLGTDSSLRDTAMAAGSSTPTDESFRPLGSPVTESPDSEAVGGDWGAVISKRDTMDGPEQEAAVAAAIAKAEKDKVAKPKKSRFSLATLRSVLERTVDVEELYVGDLTTGDHVKQDERGAKAGSDALDAQLGPWRFGEEGVDVLEDSTFIFLDPSHARTVAARRKHFCVENGKNRKLFKYDPDVVYAASFFSNFCDLNTFDLSMGPLRMGIAEYFQVRFSPHSRSSFTHITSCDRINRFDILYARSDSCRDRTAAKVRPKKKYSRRSLSRWSTSTLDPSLTSFLSS